MESTISESTAPQNRKRSRPESARHLMSYPKRRAVTACQNCRVKKSKCSNERPTCSACAALNTPCIYDERVDHTSFDPASLMILQKLHEIIDRLDSGVPPNIRPGRAQSISMAPQDSGRVPLTPLEAGPASLVDAHNHSTDRLEDDQQKVPQCSNSADVVLTWPIFEGLFGPDFLISTLLVPEDIEAGKDLQNVGQRTELTGGRAVNYEDAPALVDRFLAFVHTKNPILNVPEVRIYARRLAEEGPFWDAPSCLVLLACALGSLGQPFEAIYSRESGNAGPSQTIAPDEANIQVAERYYEIARRRFGLLRQTLITVQCYVLPGIYLMYTLQPFKAWNEFLQASINLDLYLRRQKAIAHGLNNPRRSETTRVEQRLYWTCFKSECEIRQEIPVPESGLSNITYPYLFPSPPTPSSPVMNAQTVSSITSMEASPNSTISGPSITGFSEQQSWFYYLTEITLARINNRILKAFYQSGPKGWATLAVPDAMQMAGHFEHEITEIYNNMPQAISLNCDLDDQSLIELRYMVKGGYNKVRSHLYRPFLYYMIHHGHETTVEIQSMLQPRVDRGLRHLIEVSSLEGYTHRHHGTWYVCRNKATAALVLVAAKKSGHIYMPEDWRDAILNSLKMLQYWETQSPDIAKVKLVIQEILASL